MKEKLIKGLELINEAVREFEAEHGIGTCDITFETQKVANSTRVVVHVDLPKWESVETNPRD